MGTQGLWDLGTVLCEESDTGPKPGRTCKSVMNSCRASGHFKQEEKQSPTSVKSRCTLKRAVNTSVWLKQVDEGASVKEVDKVEWKTLATLFKKENSNLQSVLTDSDHFRVLSRERKWVRC